MEMAACSYTGCHVAEPRPAGPSAKGVKNAPSQCCLALSPRCTDRGGSGERAGRGLSVQQAADIVSLGLDLPTCKMGKKRIRMPLLTSVIVKMTKVVLDDRYKK